MSEQRLLVISKHLLDMNYVQAQQTRILLRTLTAIGYRIHVVTGRVIDQSMRSLESFGGDTFALDAYWHAAVPGSSRRFPES